MSDPLLRRVGVEYADVLAALQAACFDEHWGPASIGSVLRASGGGAILALPDGSDDASPCGFALFRTVADESELLAIGVLPQARGHGVGRVLLNAVLRAAAEDGARTLLLEVAIDNQSALALYYRAGFVHVATRSLYYRRPGAPGVDARVLRCLLDPPDRAAALP